MKGIEEADLEEILERARVELSEKGVKSETFSITTSRDFIKEETKTFNGLKRFACGENHFKRNA